VVRWATIGVAVSPAALALTHDPAVAAVIAGIGAIFTAGVNLAMFDRLMSTVPHGFGVTFASVDTEVVYVAGIVGPLIAAVLADALGVGQALVVAAIASFLGALLFTVDRLPLAPVQRVGRAGALRAGPDEADIAQT